MVAVPLLLSFYSIYHMRLRPSLVTHAATNPPNKCFPIVSAGASPHFTTLPGHEVYQFKLPIYLRTYFSYTRIHFISTVRTI